MLRNRCKEKRYYAKIHVSRGRGIPFYLKEPEVEDDEEGLGCKYRWKV
jgi:hypothetical protein